MLTNRTTGGSYGGIGAIYSSARQNYRKAGGDGYNIDFGDNDDFEGLDDIDKPGKEDDLARVMRISREEYERNENKV